MILIVEDEQPLAELLQDYLIKSNYETQIVNDGNSVVQQVKEHCPALILLDLMLPGKDGMTLCKEIRAFSAVPIIMVTARVEEIDRLLGLEIGADDYICKPFSPREVVARVKAVLRRVEDKAEMKAADLELDPSRVLAKWKGNNLNLTVVEFQLLSILASEPGRIFSRNQLMDHMYQDHRVVSDRTIDSHIKKLRKKFSEFTPEDEVIHSVYGIGYKFEIIE